MRVVIITNMAMAERRLGDTTPVLHTHEKGDAGAGRGGHGAPGNRPEVPGLRRAKRPA